MTKQLKEIASSLNSDIRILILESLKNPKTVKDVLNHIHKEGHQIQYKETIYRALEKLVNAGLVEKFYDNERKAIYYVLKIEKIIIDVSNGKIELIEKS